MTHKNQRGDKMDYIHPGDDPTPDPLSSLTPYEREGLRKLLAGAIDAARDNAKRSRGNPAFVKTAETLESIHHKLFVGEEIREP
ncbi:MAG: hypothetical protein LC772_00430 [Chloroflexi bacterium]|nr:hypothetical protein [Chloroflexota bacterium]